MDSAPLLVKTTTGVLSPGAPLLVLKKKVIKKLLVVTHKGCGASLLVKTSNGAHSPGAPLLSLGRGMGPGQN